jgi:hypothetical protein
MRKYLTARLSESFQCFPSGSSTIHGADLARVYWAPGNGAAFLDLVQQLTGAPLTGDAWVASLSQDIEQLIASERVEYDEAIRVGPALPPGGGADIDMRCVLVHGEEVIADSGPAGGADAPALRRSAPHASPPPSSPPPSLFAARQARQRPHAPLQRSVASINSLHSSTADSLRCAASPQSRFPRPPQRCACRGRRWRRRSAQRR